VKVDADLHDAIVDKLLVIARSNELGRYDMMTTLSTLQSDERAAVGLLALAHDSAVTASIRGNAYYSLKALLWQDEG
jgi:hypothetical protein